MVQTATWMTTNEKRAAVGMDELPGDEANEVLIPSTLVPLTGILEPPAPALGPDGLPLPGQEPEEEGEEDEEPEMGEDGKPLPPKPGSKPPKKPPFPPKKTLDELFERAIAAEVAKEKTGKKP